MATWRSWIFRRAFQLTVECSTVAQLPLAAEHIPGGCTVPAAKLLYRRRLVLIEEAAGVYSRKTPVFWLNLRVRYDLEIERTGSLRRSRATCGPRRQSLCALHDEWRLGFEPMSYPTQKLPGKLP